LYIYYTKVHRNTLKTSVMVLVALQLHDWYRYLKLYRLPASKL